MTRLAAIFLAFLVFLAPARAVQPDEMLADPVLEARARTLSEGLRCLVCQNQSIDDSDAPLARDLRLIIREHLKAGDSDRQIVDYLVDRYGEFVLLKPRFAARTLVLWFGPFVILLAGIAIAWSKRSRPSLPAASEQALSAEEKGRLSRLLGDGR
jgi:cytochrome c-type biogenesis protein CcmH